jgi:hypothetical protein
MRCATRSERTKAGSSAATGAPTATGAVAKIVANLKARIAEITQDRDHQLPEKHDAPKAFGPEWGDY